MLVRWIDPFEDVGVLWGLKGSEGEERCEREEETGVLVSHLEDGVQKRLLVWDDALPLPSSAFCYLFNPSRLPKTQGISCFV